MLKSLPEIQESASVLLTACCRDPGWFQPHAKRSHSLWCNKSCNLPTYVFTPAPSSRGRPPCLPLLRTVPSLSSWTQVHQSSAFLPIDISHFITSTKPLFSLSHYSQHLMLRCYTWRSCAAREGPLPWPPPPVLLNTIPYSLRSD